MRKVKLTIAAIFLLLLLSRSLQAGAGYSLFLPLVNNEQPRVYAIDCMDSNGFVECP